MKPIILLIESKRSDRPSFIEGLTRKGYEVHTAPNGASALDILDLTNPHMAVIDAASMRTNGSRICGSIRRKKKDLPILLILNSSTDENENARFCADEVLYLPFTLQKLINRLKPYISLNENKMMEAGPLKLDLKDRWIHCQGRKARLTPRLFILMQKLMKHPGELLTREELFTTLWETDYLGDTRSLDVHISWLRKAVEADPRNPQYIRTERGVGYRLETEKPSRPKRTRR